MAKRLSADQIRRAAGCAELEALKVCESLPKNRIRSCKDSVHLTLQVFRRCIEEREGIRLAGRRGKKGEKQPGHTDSLGIKVINKKWPPKKWPRVRIVQEK